MRKITMVVVCVLALFAASLAEDITRDDYYNAEAQMKFQHYQMMQKRSASGDILDQADYDVKYWELDIDVTNIQGEIVSGKVTMTSESVIMGLTEVDYNFDSAMSADSIFMYGQPVSYTHSNDLITITLDHTYNFGEQFTTVVYYHGHPPGGGFGSFTWETHQGHPIISTLSEPWGAREWWPCKDIPHDKADSADVLITIPDNLIGTSNGLLVAEIDNGNGTKTFHWHESYPITTYLISLAISNYQSFTDWYVYTSNDSMPIVNYVYPEHFNNAVEDLNITAEAIGVLAEKFGEYPFLDEKYGHSIFPWGGAMEHQCNTSYGAVLISGNHWYDYIVVHELGHMWFGDMITCDSWPDIWINEGFAVFTETVWFEYLGGLEAYLNYMVTHNYVTDPSGPIYDPNPLFSGNTVYRKGCWVLHMLRGVMGDEDFFDGMYAYANNPQFMFKTATCRDFQHAMEPFYGDSLGWFFDEWLWGMNRPHYRYSWIKENIGGGQYEVFLHIRQTQGYPAPEVFTMPIKIYPRIGGVDTLITVWNDSREDDWRFIVDGDPTSLEVDKYKWILREVYSESYSLNIVTTELPDGYLNVNYDELVEARGGTTPYSFAVISGSLPAGLNLSGNTGVISGQPTALGDYEFTIRCTDNNNSTDDQDYEVSILSAPVPDMQVVFTPINPPITIPQGGSFQFTASVTNNDSNSWFTDCWIGLRLPGLSYYGPIEIYYNIYFPGNSTINFNNLSQSVPVFAPLGDYEYIGYTGDYPNNIYDSSFFDFTVVAPMGKGGGANSWVLKGWPDGSADNAGLIPELTSLVGNYPNPFNSATRIKFDLAEPGYVNLNIYNLAGQLTETLLEANMPAGEHVCDWDASSYSSGIYFYKLSIGDKVFTRRMTLLK